MEQNKVPGNKLTYIWPNDFQQWFQDHSMGERRGYLTNGAGEIFTGKRVSLHPYLMYKIYLPYKTQNGLHTQV
jgi:hypothetical protein